MIKLILVAHNAAPREIMLAKERIMIGRGPHNDIVIDDCAISAEHAVITMVDGDSLVEDWNSTNGTQVNGQPVRRHFLRDGDVIELAGYELRFQLAKEDFDKVAVERKSMTVSNSSCVAKSVARITILNGANAGNERVLLKPITTIGHPKVQVAIIARRVDGYYLTPLDGSEAALINGKRMSVGGQRMINGDLIELGGTRLRFLAE